MLAGIIQEIRCITFRCNLRCGTVGERKAFVGREMWFVRARVFEFKE
jgi:hypothetical protein